MCAEVQQALLAALADDLRTADAVEALRRSLELDLPGGCLKCSRIRIETGVLSQSDPEGGRPETAVPPAGDARL